MIGIVEGTGARAISTVIEIAAGTVFRIIGFVQFHHERLALVVTVMVDVGVGENFIQPGTEVRAGLGAGEKFSRLWNILR